MSLVTGRPCRLEIEVRRHGVDALRLAVCDSGVGLRLQERDRIFDAFQTTKPQGMGMGRGPYTGELPAAVPATGD
jgi:signal transduction histidine kinase